MIVIKKALFITYDKFPDIDAGAVRTHMFANMLYDAGYSVRVISMGPYTGKTIKYVDGIEYKSYRLSYDNFLGKVLAYLIFPLRLIFELIRYDSDVCIHTQVSRSVLDVLKKYCKKKNKIIVYDAVEWFSPEQFEKGENSKVYKINDAYNQNLIQGKHKVIAISKYLTNHFQEKKVKVINIPVVLDIRNLHVHKFDINNKIKIIYAGSPGKKDFLHVIIQALTKINKNELDKLRLEIIGCTKENLVNCCGVSKKDLITLKDVLDIKGRISREKVLDEYASANFSILIRSQNQRYAKAGFPTKFVESLSLSTPVICNLTSDLGDYVIDGINGIIVKDESVEACYQAFKQILLFDKKELKAMQTAAKEMALKNFDYRKYTQKLVDFIESVE